MSSSSEAASGDNLENIINKNEETERIYGEGESRRILKNVIVLSIAFTLLFTTGSLMSSLNPNGLGNYASSTSYGALVISCIFLPTFLISKFSVKWTLICSVFGNTIYMAAQFKPMYSTLIPAAVIVGLTSAPLWSSKCTYLTHIGHEYARIIGEASEGVIVRFFGIFFLFFQSSQIWGNLISSLILGSEESTNSTFKNISVCGINFCPKDAVGGAIREVSDVSRYSLSAIFVTSSILAAILLSFFLDPLTRYGEKERVGESDKLSGLSLILATSRHMKKPTQILLIPLTIWSGLEQGFFSADFTQAYISCGWDISKVGFVMISYGISDSLSSVIFGPIVKKVGRAPVFIFGAIVNASVIALLFLWQPDPSQRVVYFVIASLWGVGDAIWQTQINALYGVLFKNNEEAAFSNYRLWESIGFIIAFVSGNNLCIDIKLINLSIVLLLGIIGYLAVEIMERKKKLIISAQSYLKA